MNTIGDRLKHLRLFKKLTQKDFALLIKINQGALSELENNKSKPSIDTIISVCQYCHVNPMWILTGEGDMFLTLNQQHIDTIDPEILYELQELGTIEQAEVRGFIKGLKRRTHLQGITYKSSQQEEHPCKAAEEQNVYTKGND